MLKIGLIGAGWHAMADHAPALRHCADSEAFRGRVELTGAYDVDRAKAAGVAARFGFRRAYDSLDAMLADVDAVLSIVPAAAMAATLETIVRYGRPVLIEKPPGRDILETRRVADLLDGHPHMVSLNRRFDPAVAIARQWLARQTRPPRFVHGLVMRRDRREPDFSWSTGVHMADLLCFLAGPLEFARGRRTPFKRVGYLVGEHPMYAAIELWPAAHRVAETVHMGGDGWWARIETGTHQPWRVVCHRDRADEIDAAADPATPAFVRNGTADETATFLRGLLDRRWTGPTLGDAVAGTCIAQSLQDLNEANEAPL